MCLSLDAQLIKLCESNLTGLGTCSVIRVGNASVSDSTGKRCVWRCLQARMCVSVISVAECVCVIGVRFLRDSLLFLFCYFF